MNKGKELIIQAFRQAKYSGKSDWYRMTTAVLKNRLLGLTDRKFTEADYGASSLTDFVMRFDDILDLDEKLSPTVVELKPKERDSLDSGSVSGTPGHIRIRADLWRAIFDRSSGNTYYWLTNMGVLGTSPIEGHCPVLPTIDAETDRQWRQSFIDSLSSPPSQAAEWATSLLPLSKLPPELRSLWNRTLTGHVHQRLSGWFKEQEVEPPSDFISEVRARQDTQTTGFEALRRLVQRVIQEMTEEELSQLSLPPRAVLKATTRGRHD